MGGGAPEGSIFPPNFQDLAATMAAVAAAAWPLAPPVSWGLTGPAATSSGVEGGLAYPVPMGIAPPEMAWGDGSAGVGVAVASSGGGSCPDSASGPSAEADTRRTPPRTRSGDTSRICAWQTESPEASQKQVSDAAAPRTPPKKTGASEQVAYVSPKSCASSPRRTGGCVEAWQNVGTPSPQQAHYRTEYATGLTPMRGISEVAPFGSILQEAAAAVTTLQAAQFARMPGPATPVHRAAFYPAAGPGSGGCGMQCYTNGGTPVVPMGFSPGFFPLCRPAPHIVTPVQPPPLPFSSPVQHRPCGGHGLTPGPVRAGERGGVSQDYTARCMADWQHSDA